MVGCLQTNLPEPKNLIYSFVRTIFNKQLLVLLLILLYKLQTQIGCQLNPLPENLTHSFPYIDKDKVCHNYAGTVFADVRIEFRWGEL